MAEKPETDKDKIISDLRDEVDALRVALEEAQDEIARMTEAAE